VNWLDKAVCASDKHSDYWLSYDLEKIDYAKSGCDKCTVHIECFTNSISMDDEPVGVIAGLSEFERLLARWREVTDINGSNWE
jgi:hypothetical protein